MTQYTVKQDTKAIAVPVEMINEAAAFQVIATRQKNAFNEGEILINPLTKMVSPAIKNQMLGMCYAQNGFFGFRRGEYCLIVAAKNVFAQSEAA